MIKSKCSEFKLRLKIIFKKSNKVAKVVKVSNATRDSCNYEDIKVPSGGTIDSRSYRDNNNYDDPKVFSDSNDLSNPILLFN